MKIYFKKKGYKKHSSMRDNDNYVWVKPFGKSKYEDDRSNYQVAFSIYDFSSSIYNRGDNPYTCLPSILLSRSIDERMDLEISSIAIYETNIEYIETLAQSFYEWADKNVKL